MPWWGWFFVAMAVLWLIGRFVPFPEPKPSSTYTFKIKPSVPTQSTVEADPLHKHSNGNDTTCGIVCQNCTKVHAKDFPNNWPFTVECGAVGCGLHNEYVTYAWISTTDGEMYAITPKAIERAEGMGLKHPRAILKPGVTHIPREIQLANCD